MTYSFIGSCILVTSLAIFILILAAFIIIPVALALWAWVDDLDDLPYAHKLPVLRWFFEAESLKPYRERSGFEDSRIGAVTGKYSGDVINLNDLTPDQVEQLKKKVPGLITARLRHEYLFAAVLAPAVIFHAIFLWKIVLAASFVAALLYLARALRRGQKAFRQHVNDPNAHTDAGGEQ